MAAARCSKSSGSYTPGDLNGQGSLPPIGKRPAGDEQNIALQATKPPPIAAGGRLHRRRVTSNGERGMHSDLSGPGRPGSTNSPSQRRPVDGPLPQSLGPGRHVTLSEANRGLLSDLPGGNLYPRSPAAVPSGPMSRNTRRATMCSLDGSPVAQPSSCPPCSSAGLRGLQDLQRPGSTPSPEGGAGSRLPSQPPRTPLTPSARDRLGMVPATLGRRPRRFQFEGAPAPPPGARALRAPSPAPALERTLSGEVRDAIAELYKQKQTQGIYIGDNHTSYGLKRATGSTFGGGWVRPTMLKQYHKVFSDMKVDAHGRVSFDNFRRYISDTNPELGRHCKALFGKLLNSHEGSTRLAEEDSVEFHNVLKILFPHASDKELDILRQMSSNFGLPRRRDVLEKLHEAREVFRALDKHSAGSITKQEMEDGLVAMGEDLVDAMEQVDDLFLSRDKTGEDQDEDGEADIIYPKERVNFAEFFCRWFLPLPVLQNALQHLE